MPYCVRCGVELQKDTKSCPLCRTEVILPQEQESGEKFSAFPDRVQVSRRLRPTINLVPSRSFLFLATFILLVPILVTFIVDFTNNGRVTWSFYPMTSLALLWVLIAYPVILRGHTLLLLLTVDIFALILFLLSLDYYIQPFPDWSHFPTLSLLLLWIYLAAPLIFTWNHPILIMSMWFIGSAYFLALMDQFTDGADWFLPLALPILSLVLAFGLTGLIVIKTTRGKPLLMAGLYSLAATVFLTATDGIVNLYMREKLELTWSPILAAVLVPSSVFLILVNRNPELRAYLAKKFHL